MILMCVPRPSLTLLPASAGFFIAFLALLLVPTAGWKAGGDSGGGAGRGGTWPQDAPAKSRAEDELSLLQSTLAVASGVHRETSDAAGADAPAAARPASDTPSEPRPRNSADAEHQRHSADAKRERPAALIEQPQHAHRSFVEASLDEKLVSRMFPVWLQAEESDVAEAIVRASGKMVMGMTTMEIVLLIVGICLIFVGLSYFVVAFTWGNTEPGEKTPSQPPSRRSGASATPTQSGLMAQKYSLTIPSVLEAPHEHSKKTTYEIKDASGKKLLNVEVMRPFQDDDTDIGAPHEYVSLHSKDGDEELAMCALAPTGDGNWECNLYQGETELYGSLVAEASTSKMSGDAQFALVSPNGERLLVLRGRPQERQLEVLDHNGTIAAVVHQGSTTFRGIMGGHEFYQAECLIDADVGLIVLSLLAVDRLMSHRRRR